jgi:hypothetical protein
MTTMNRMMKVIMRMKTNRKMKNRTKVEMKKKQTLRDNLIK